MSTSIENLRRLAERDIKDHTALFDLYVTVGRNIDYLSIKFGIDPEDLINLLEGYGEKIRVEEGDQEALARAQAAAAEAHKKKSNRRSRGGKGFLLGGTGAEADLEFGMILDYSGRGRFKNLPRMFIEEYIDRFYPGIASENPENDWICLDTYLAVKHPQWRRETNDERSFGDDNG